MLHNGVGRIGRVARHEEGSFPAVKDAVGDWLFSRRAYAPERQRVLCIGDSHVKIMRQVAVPGYWLKPFFVDGATASGITNPNSVTRSMMLFNRRLARAKPWQRVAVQLGEVDCGFVIWHRAERHGTSVEEQLQRTLGSYSAFLASVLEMGFPQVVVLSAPAPTISDARGEWGAVANLRSEISASQRERTDLTVEFNQHLSDCCLEIGATFVDVTSQHIDPKTRLITPEFLRPTQDDHHLADEPYAALIAHELRGYLS